MALIIDGYNLLNAANILPRGRGPNTLEQSRRALLNFLVHSLEPSELAQTTVVFDAGPDAPRGLPREERFGEITVRYSSEYEDADALIEELIQANTAPRRLTVVSSDHRLHRAARRRRATAIDSERWYAEARQRRRGQSPPSKPQQPPSPSDVDFWLQQFSDDVADQTDQATDNPFPPGYAEDISDDD